MEERLLKCKASQLRAAWRRWSHLFCSSNSCAWSPRALWNANVWAFLANYAKLKNSLLWQGYDPSFNTVGRVSWVLSPLSCTSACKWGISRQSSVQEHANTIRWFRFLPGVSHSGIKWGSLRDLTCNDFERQKGPDMTSFLRLINHDMIYCIPHTYKPLWKTKYNWHYSRSGEALQTAVKRREAKSKGEKERYKHLNAEFQKIPRRDKKAFLSDQCKEIKENTEWERLEISSRKLEILKEHFMQRWAQ